MAGRLASAVSRARPKAPAASKQKSKPKRAQHRPTTTTSNSTSPSKEKQQAKSCTRVSHLYPVYPGPSGSRSKPPSVKSILKRSGIAVSSPPVPPTTNLSPTRLDVPLSTGSSCANGTAPASGTLIRRRPAIGALELPISVCTQFATWLENQKCVHDETLLRAVERDGSHLLSLAKATVMFDNALRGHVPPTFNCVVTPLVEHARTLRVFAELLKTKISEGSLSEELETAVLRDGEALLCLAISCLEFDQAIRGSDSAQVK